VPFVVNVVVLKIKKKEDKNNKEDKDKIKEINNMLYNSKGTNNKYHNINNHKIINYQKQCNKV